MEDPRPFVGIDPANLSSANIKGLEKLEECIRSLYSAIDRYRSALHLYDHIDALRAAHLHEITERTPKREESKKAFMAMGGWPHIAAEGAIESIVRFYDALQIIEKWQMERGSAAFPNPQFGKLGLKMFESKFPSFRAIRNAVAHSTEIVLDAEKHVYKGKIADGPIRTEGGKTLITNLLVGRKFTTSRKGQLLELVLTEESGQKLLDIYKWLMIAVGAYKIPTFEELRDNG